MLITPTVRHMLTELRGEHDFVAFHADALSLLVAKTRHIPLLRHLLTAPVLARAERRIANLRSYQRWLDVSISRLHRADRAGTTPNLAAICAERRIQRGAAGLTRKPRPANHDALV